MAKNSINIKANDPNQDEDFFFQQLGSFLREMRKAAGYSSIRAFVDTIDMSYSQYQGYETGKNITLAIFRKVLLQFNIKVEDWLMLDIFTKEKVDKTIVEKMHSAQIEQVRKQVCKTENKEAASKLNEKEIERYINILIYCNRPQPRSKILKHLELADTVNNFKRAAHKLIEYGWLEYTDQKSPNSLKQQYITTAKGKTILKLEY